MILTEIHTFLVYITGVCINLHCADIFWVMQATAGTHHIGAFKVKKTKQTQTQTKPRHKDEGCGMFASAAWINKVLYRWKKINKWKNPQKAGLRRTNSWNSLWINRFKLTEDLVGLVQCAAKRSFCACACIRGKSEEYTSGIGRGKHMGGAPAEEMSELL